jgi:peptide deformylase
MRTIIPEEQNPILHHPAHPVPVSDISGQYIQTLITEMKDLLSVEKYGVALAAPQVGEPLRLFIVSGRALRKRANPDSESPAEPQPDLVYINPVLVKMSKAKKDKHEGCLSVRGYWGKVPRAEKVTIEAYDENANKITRGASGFLAHIFQHELDHLDGVMYTDKAIEIQEEVEDEDPE